MGSRFPIIFRFSQWKTGHYDAKLAYTPEELEAFLAPLTDAGVDIFDCSTRRFWEPEFEGSRLNLAGWTRKLTGKPTISVGSVGLKGDFTNAFDGGPEAEAASVEPLVERLKAGEFDLIAVGRALLADAEWAEKYAMRGKRNPPVYEGRPENAEITDQASSPISAVIIIPAEETLLFLPDADSQVQQPQKNQGRNLKRQQIPRSGTEIFQNSSSRGIPGKTVIRIQPDIHRNNQNQVGVAQTQSPHVVPRPRAPLQDGGKVKGGNQ